MRISDWSSDVCSSDLGTHAFLDIVAGNDEVLAIVGPAARDDMDVGIVRVPVIDTDPIELGAEVLLHLPHQLEGEGLEVGHLWRVLGRDDEPEMMPVVLSPLGEGLGIELGRAHACTPDTNAQIVSRTMLE